MVSRWPHLIVPPITPFKTDEKQIARNSYCVMFRHRNDNWMFCFRVELGRVGSFKPHYIPAKLDNGQLHAETNSQEGNLMLSCPVDRRDLSFSPSGSEASRYNNTICGAELLESFIVARRVSKLCFVLQIFRVNEFYHEFSIDCKSGMFQS